MNNDIIFILLGTVFCALAALRRNRRQMLLMSSGAMISFAIYWAMEGQMVATSITLAALAGITIQMATPDRLLSATFLPRLGSTLVIAAIGFSLTYQGYADLIPLTAFLIARLGEVFTRATTIRGAYLVSTALWMAFSHITGNDFAALCNLSVLSVQLFASLRDSRFLALRLAAVKRIAK